MGIRFTRPEAAGTACWVVSDSWPGWLHVLPSFSFLCKHLFTSSPATAWVAQLVHSHPGCNVSLLTPRMNFPPLDHDISFIFLQGSAELASWLPPQWSQQCTIVGSWDHHMLHQCLPLWPQLCLTHSDYGGVISGNWVFSSTQHLPCPEVPPLSVRTLRHIIEEARPVSSFHACEPPEMPEKLEVETGDSSPRILWTDSDSVVLDWNSLLPVGSEQSSLVRCPLVYSPTRWSTRRLTRKELLSVFDVSETFLPTFQYETKLPFLHSAPNRLLCAVLGAVAHESQPRFKSIEPENLRPELNRPVWPTTNDTQWKGISESTTTADDAKAHILVWNKRVLLTPHSSIRIQNFQAIYGREALDTLREFLLGRWRRRVYKSLIIYLQKEHGCDWWMNPNATRDIDVGRDCIQKASDATWWDWAQGSTPFFWRWPPATQHLIRDGHPP